MIMAMMLPSLTKLGILIDFKINQDFIAEVLCINRDKPLNKCNGKCYLSKKLKKAEEQEEKQLPTIKLTKLEMLCCASKNHFDFLKYTFTYLSRLNAAYAREFYFFSFIADIFHPPKLRLI